MTNEIRKFIGNKLKIFLILCLSVFLPLSQLSFIQAVNRTNFGVQEGDSYNFEVSNDGRNNFSGRGSRTGDFTGIPSDFTRSTDFTADFGGGGLGSLFGNLSDFENDNFGLRPKLRIPSTGTIYSVGIAELPTNSTIGVFSYSVPGVGSSLVDSYFIYSDPVISLDWEGWSSELTSIISELNAQSSVKTAVLNRLDDSGNYFDAEIFIELNSVTRDFNNNTIKIDYVKMVQSVRYDKNIGLRLDYKLVSDISSNNFGEQSTTSQIIFTNENTRLVRTQQNDIIPILTVLIAGGLGVGRIFVYRAGNKPTDSVNVMQIAKVKEKAILDDLKTKLQNIEQTNLKDSKNNITSASTRKNISNSSLSNPKPKLRSIRR